MRSFFIFQITHFLLTFKFSSFNPPFFSFKGACHRSCDHVNAIFGQLKKGSEGELKTEELVTFRSKISCKYISVQ